jgi:hypothetical protein
MNDQLGLFDAALGEARKEEAVTRVEANASRAWLDAAWNAVIVVCLEHRQYERVTSDDVWRVLLDEDAPSPHEPRAMGPIMRRAVAEGRLTATADFRPSELPQNHRRPVRVYEVTR